ncbi:pyridine nucleotide-disulfide oxidoreductase [Actinocatenispora thailandica]|uniref:Pyridine nucleotide-disulfide oxidoreductase n=1 Tax=Actinocatenispora thailandica TaxID=227318 RepID=A0A7R7HW67_9ACTN|nr:NAD(P)/FAD-dependent oxidoreductase [Actinocatenispora thailandica]BCJ33649.1 pyridine nucleotide-disulfide oxidoreductase [Actinocatenispora thailandica]
MTHDGPQWTTPFPEDGRTDAGQAPAGAAPSTGSEAAPAGTGSAAEPDVAVVGAGPAGLAAATVLAEHGADVLVVDEQLRPGGQIYRQPPASFTERGGPAGTAIPAGRRLLSAAADAPVRWWPGTVAWGVFGAGAGLDDFAAADAPPGRLRLATHGPAGTRLVHPRLLLLTAGAYDLPVPFPGWTLPGVLTAGGVQVFVKAQRLVPGRRFVLAGAHPLVLVVAAQLIAAGAEVAEVALAVRRPGVAAAWRALPAVAGNTGKLAEGARALGTLRRARVPVRFGTMVTAALPGADGTLGAVRLADLAADDTPVPGTEREVGADVLALGYGFVPSTELARQAGCATRYDAAGGGWVIEHDRWQRASLPGVYVAGEVTGVAGAEQATAEGRLAGLGALVELGRVRPPTADRLARPVRRELRRRRRLAGLLADTFAPPDAALAAVRTDDTVLCRCEEVTVGAVRAALRGHPHLRTANAVKLVTRAGMGMCQGRSCQPGLCALVAAETGQEVAAVGSYTARPPVKPIPLTALSDPG